jgi:DNA-binding transcriptional MerR regulator
MDANRIPASEYIYTSKEVYTTLEISDSTLRAWCLKLEAEGYQFRREDNSSRIFYEHDIIALRKMKNLLDNGHSMKSVIKEISSKYKDITPAVIVDEVAAGWQELALSERFSTEDLRNELDEIKSLLYKQGEFNKLLLSKVDEQQQYIEQSIKERDQQLTATLRQLLENKKQKSWWRRFWE